MTARCQTSIAKATSLIQPFGGFTIVELLVVIAVIAILTALLFPSISAAKSKAQRTSCMNQLRQINLGLRMYSDDSADKTPRTPSSTNAPGLNWTGYKNLMKSYVGLNGASSTRDKLFACPADVFYYDFITNIGTCVPHGLHEEPPDYSSYAFNGGNARNNSNAPGIAGRTLASVKNPAKTVLLMESAALIPYSWHDPKRPFGPDNAIFNNALDMVSFVDGHVSYIKMYWGGNNPPGALALHQNPPPDYEYQWSGE